MKTRNRVLFGALVALYGCADAPTPVVVPEDSERAPAPAVENLTRAESLEASIDPKLLALAERLVDHEWYGVKSIPFPVEVGSIGVIDAVEVIDHVSRSEVVVICSGPDPAPYQRLWLRGWRGLSQHEIFKPGPIICTGTEFYEDEDGELVELLVIEPFDEYPLLRVLRDNAELQRLRAH